MFIQSLRMSHCVTFVHMHLLSLASWVFPD